ncbi:MAG: serine--tRNA ligase [Candidatus Woesearchaeota archaeon]
MLNIQFIRENKELVKENIKKRFQEQKIPLVEELLKTDEKWRKLKSEIDGLRSERNKLSEQINQLKKADKDIKAILQKVKDIPEEIKEKEKTMQELSNKRQELLAKIPNIIHKSVPIGKDAEENKTVKTWGKTKKQAFKAKTHVELIEELGLADFEKSAEISGNGFYILKGDLALLNQALIQFAIGHMEKKGYVYIEPPLMLHQNILGAALDLEEFSKTIYRVDDGDLCLIGTSEYSLLGLHSNSFLQENELPKKYFSYTMCFRKEVGSHGINEKGLWRTHQFNKVEQFIFCKPEDSYTYYDELLNNSEEIFQALKLPYRVLECCSGDLAAWKSKSCDIEVWRPTTGKYEEVCSLSNCTGFQAENLNIKVVRKDGKRETLHTLNNTAIATSRAIVVLIENYQNKDGSVSIPEALQPYMGGRKKLRPLKKS